MRDARVEGGVVRFVAELSRQTGMFLQRPTNSANPTLLIHAVHGSEKAQKLSEYESYELVISQSGANLTAPNSLGIRLGLQTFLQLVEITANAFALPVLSIHGQ